jgi:hypothetical protein
MRTAQELFQERSERIRRTVALQSTDRPPVVLHMDGFCARHMGVKMKELCASLERSSQIIFDSLNALGDVDGVVKPCGAATIFPLNFMCRIKLPGRELDDDTLWQLDEKELMTIEDYDAILARGWAAFKDDYARNRLSVDPDEIARELAGTAKMEARFEDAGYVVYTKGSFTLVNEALSGGRSMGKFMRDLYKIPDKVEAVLDVIQESELKRVPAIVRATKSEVVFVTPARGAPSFYAPKLWERFVGKYLWQLSSAIIEAGAAVNIHADGNWERELDFFRQFPKGTCIFEADSGTNLRKFKEHLGDRICIKGDVPPALLSHGTPDEVYDYCTKLIKDMGDGFILASGCSVPDLAKVDNVKAMIAAATGK